MAGIICMCIVHATMIRVVFSIFFLAELIRFIPCCLDEYLECRVQMHDKYKEYETQHTEYDEKYYLYSHDREECDDTRYREGKHEKYDRDYDRTKIEKDHRIVELHRDTDMTYCHTSRE